MSRSVASAGASLRLCTSIIPIPQAHATGDAETGCGDQLVGRVAPGAPGRNLTLAACLSIGGYRW